MFNSIRFVPLYVTVHVNFLELGEEMLGADATRSQHVYFAHAIVAENDKDRKFVILRSSIPDRVRELSLIHI